MLGLTYMRSIKSIERYFFGRLSELESLAKRGDPWVFLCASSYIEYLMKIVLGRSGDQEDYKNFLLNYFFKACSKYAAYRFSFGTNDLHVQMYHVLRCGIVHSFSLIPDPKARRKGGRYRSILLAHQGQGYEHLQPVIRNRMRPKIDSVVFVAQDFVGDLKEATNYVFRETRKREPAAKQIRDNMLNWFKEYPPIGIKMIE
jgi:hypothetical protein